jgi:Ni,Fe-hydrogenase I cytochrome b subunit
VSFFLDLLFGAIGSGFMLYGKKQYDGVFAVFGLLLIVFPYFVSNAILTLLIGAALTAAPLVHARGMS